MIPFEVELYRAESVDDLVRAWREASSAGRTPAFYGGGSELLTQARENRNRADVYIDYKRVPEAQWCAAGALPGESASGERQMILGAALRLNAIVDAPGAGLFARCAGGVADRTVRNTITLGGNVCGRLAYREALLPFLLLDGHVHVVDCATTAGIEARPLAEVCDRRLLLSPASVVVALSVAEAPLTGLGLFTATAGGRPPKCADRDYGAVIDCGAGPRGAWYYRRRTRDSRLDYPLVTVAMVVLDGAIRVAISGAVGYPMRARELEEHLNARGLNEIMAAETTGLRSLCEEAVDRQRFPFRKDMRASAEYRRELTVQSIEDGLRACWEQLG